MKVVLTNLSDELYKDSRLRLNQSAGRFGIENIMSYGSEDLKGTVFFSKNEEILSIPKGIGYWLWKPYIILEAMKTLSDGDIVVYSDCGIEIIADINPLISICAGTEPVLLFGNGNFQNNIWTKRDCFVFMDCDSEAFWFGPHCDAAFALFRKCDRASQFLQEWLEFGSNKNIITDLPNICGKENISGYSGNRCDQSIVSLLAQKYKLSLYRMPTQFGNHYKIHSLRIAGEFNCVNQSNQSQVGHYATIPYYNSGYGQLLNHHRAKKAGYLEPTSYKMPFYNRTIAKCKRIVKSIFSIVGLQIPSIWDNFVKIPAFRKKGKLVHYTPPKSYANLLKIVLNKEKRI